MMALIITPEEPSRTQTNHYIHSNNLGFEPYSDPCCIPQDTCTVGQSQATTTTTTTTTTVVIRNQEELDREVMDQPHVIRRRPTCRFMNTAFFKDLKAIGGAEDMEEQRRNSECGGKGEDEYGNGSEEETEEYGEEYEKNNRLSIQLNPLGNDLPPGHDPPLGFGHPSWEPIGDLAIQEAEEIISSLEMIPELPEPQDNRSERLLYIERTVSALSGERERFNHDGSQSEASRSRSQSQADGSLTASDASSQTSWITHVTSEHRPLWGETKPINTKLIVSRLNEEETRDPEGLDLYYLPDLKEWRPFPVEVEVWNAPEPVQALKKKSRVRRIAGAVATKIKCGTYGYHFPRPPLDKRLISMPIQGSKRGMIQALLEDK